MKSDQKLDLDAMLARWPAPARDDAAWESRAEAIMAAAVAARSAAGEPAMALLAAPPLAAEAGEPASDGVAAGGTGADSVAGRKGAVGSEGPGSGERKMSDGTNQGGPKDPGSPASEQPRKKQSLKDIATRASQSGRSSIPASAPTSATGTPVPRSATATPIPSSRALEAKADDSGMVDLKVVQATVTPQQVAAAEKAKPGSSDLFEDEEKIEGAPPTKRAGGAVAAVKAPPPAPQRGGVVIAIGLAAIGVAAAVLIMMRGAGQSPASKPGAEARPVETAAATATAAQAAASATAAPAEVAAAETPSATPIADSRGGPATPGAAGGAAPSGDTGKLAAADPRPALGGPAPAAVAPAAKGDLTSQMAAATGADKNKSGATDANPEPASGGGSKNSSVPEKPPQGSVQAAIRAVSGNAKACVAGADDISRANVTFGSNGAVTSVSVSGWAAGKGAASCIKTALKGANVGPFSSPSFTVTVPIRP